MDPMEVHQEVGVEGHALRSDAAPDPTDTTIRLTGNDNSCLKFTGFTAEEDTCLKNPSQCPFYDNANENRTGLSMSLWINLPQSFTQEQRYILDTGGDEFGGTGVAVTVRGSMDGRRHNQQLTVIVSTGNEYWKVVLNGMIIAYAWNNVGFRWSPTISSSDSAPYGLQVFINGTSVAWKRSSYSSGSPAITVTAAGVDMTLGCALDGTYAAQGRYDNLAAWYWALRDNTGSRFGKPSLTDDPGEIKDFVGGLDMDTVDVYTDGQKPVLRYSDMAPGPTIGYEPWQYVYERAMLSLEALQNEHFLDDISAAIEGDCDSQNPSSWGNLNHPVECADTRKELESALEYNDEYSGGALVKAMVRVVNKNTLSPNDLIWLTTGPLINVKSKLDAEPGTLDPKAGAKFYAWITFVVSKLQKDQYAPEYEKLHNTFQSEGLSLWTRELDEILLTVTEKMMDGSAVLTESNDTVAALLNIQKTEVTAGIQFPDYSLQTEDAATGDAEIFYKFPETRKKSWGLVTDWIQFHIGGFAGWNSLSASIRVVLKMFNKLDLSWPAFLDDRITGVTGEKFFLNSRVLSLSFMPPMDNASVLDQFPVRFMVEHKSRQPDLPYLKGAVLCVHWNYDNLEPNLTNIGAWDTAACRLMETNDTHSTCECSHFSDYAILLEDHIPSGSVPDGAYYFCYVLYAISLICLIIMVGFIIWKARLHYELHIITMNIAFGLIFAIIFYLSALGAKNSRSTCIAVSILMHYSYSAAYMWFVILAHYIFRAVTSGRLGSILTYYCLGGWGVPAVIVIIMASIDITRYGIGDRCLGAQSNYFLWVYIGIFIFLALLVCPLNVISFINMGKTSVRDPEDKADTIWALIGSSICWPVILLTWIMAIFVYLVPQDSQVPDFLFEFLNSLQGIMVFGLLGILIPSFRNTLLCRREQPVPKNNELYGSQAGDFEPPPRPTESRSPSSDSVDRQPLPPGSLEPKL